MQLTCLLVALLTFISICQVLGSIEERGSFVEANADFRSMQRRLLQDEMDEEDDADESDMNENVEDNSEEETKPTGIIEPGVDQLGWDLFYTKNFLMKVAEPIKITDVGGQTYSVDASAISIAGSAINDHVSEFTIDWKNKDFGGAKGIQITMQFNESRTQFTLLDMELQWNNKVDKLKVKTEYGYKVNAPIGLAWACDYPGMFRPIEAGSRLAGITFPGIRLQVFFEELKMRNFGPLWYCGELMPIGLWVGLIVTLFFALVCYWGFSMLASVQTMDRFDDPKGKQIYVPQTE